jgi:uncharacterized iron-regulated membrane protein
MLRKAFFWTHLAAGVTTGTVILIMSVTGVLLTYERQLIEWADGYAVTPSSPDATPLGVEQLAAIAREGRTAELASITLRKAPAPAAFAFGREGTVFLDPYSGAVLGQGSARARAFFRSVTDWHRWLAMSGDSRPTGRAVTGASNLAFLFIVLSGIVLWWPKGLSWKRLRPVTLFQGGLSGKARDFNWHNVFGFWSAIPLAVIVAGGVVISYPWATDLVYRLTGSEPPRRPAAPTGGPGARGEGQGQREAKPPVPLDGLDRAWATAASQVSGWQSLSLRVPNAADAPFAFTIDTWAAARQPSTRSQMVVGRDGQIVRFEPYASQSRGAKVRGWLRFLHTGEAFGVVGQTIAGIASAGAVMLVWTGVTLALRRFAAWRQRRAKAREAAPAPSDAAAA